MPGMSNEPPKIGIIGGTGMEQALGVETGEQVWPDTPFGKPSAAITLTQWHGVEMAILKRHGEGHVLPPSQVPFRANIFALKALGVTHLVATGATGSLVERVRPGDLVIVDQVIDKTYKRANTFYEGAAVHVELAEPFCPVMRAWLLSAAKQIGAIYERDTDRAGGWEDPGDERPKADVVIHPEGTYVVMEGPAFSTRAESLMHRGWGGTLIGMTAMPEAKLAREAEIAYALIGLPTDYDCWKTDETYGAHADLLSSILANLKHASDAGYSLLKTALQDVSALREQASPAHEALKLGIWSDKSKIAAEEVAKLKPLWGKYFV